MEVWGEIASLKDQSLQDKYNKVAEVLGEIDSLKDQQLFKAPNMFEEFHVSEPPCQWE